MKIVIIGAGALGSLLGAKLSAVAEVHLLTGWQAQIEAVERGGLSLLEPDGTETLIPLALTADPDGLDHDADWVVVCVKAHQTERAARQAALLLKPEGLTLTLQNGLGQVEKLAAVLGRDKIVPGVTAEGATVLSAGRVFHAGRGVTWLTVTPVTAKRVAALQHLFERAGFETRLSADLEAVVWGKLVVNAGINALTAILGVPNGVLAQTETAEQIMLAAATEAVMVARAKGISLPDDDPLARVRAVALATAANRSSMLADILRGSPTEVDAINGAIVAEAERLGLDAPVNRLLAALVKAIEATRAQRLG